MTLTNRQGLRTMKWPIFQNISDPLETIAAVSRYYGSSDEFVIAGGGNTSYKDNERLWIKASGRALADIDPRGFVELDRAALDAKLTVDFSDDPTEREAQYKDGLMAARVQPERGQRASVESLMHHVIPGCYVVHTHATELNKLTCSIDGEELAREQYGDDILWIPFVDPGYTLSKVIAEALAKYERETSRSKPRGILLQNHGVIVFGDDPETIRIDMEWLIAPLARELGIGANELENNSVLDDHANQIDRTLTNRIGPALRLLLADDARTKIVSFNGDDIVRYFVDQPDGKSLTIDGPLTPDQIVYCKSFPLWFEAMPSESDEDLVKRLRDAVAAHERTTRFPPKVVLVPGLGMFTAGDDCNAADITRRVYTDAIKIMIGAIKLGGVNYLSERDREFIDNWEVEQYRRQVAAVQRSTGRAEGKIAVVTGAAQGFGRGIAEQLVGQGAHVVLADINLAIVEQVVEELTAAHGSGRAVGLSIDVSDGESIAAAVNETVRLYGGLDIFIANAGVLSAGSVLSLAEGAFDFVTEVNYKGYFLCVQKVAPILVIQHLVRPDVWTDIIQINSKSGLTGSARNGAYAGSKFGGIGLTQSFALELIANGVKVNAICPGNYYDGPLWSDPNKGLLVQYLKAGKIPGAKTVEDVRRAYEAKTPMRRGCTVDDVMKAVFYVIEQQYETGQAIPVTGGQIMLS